MEHLDPDEMALLALGESTTTDHFADGGSDPSQSPEQHLRECAVCRTELAQLTHTVQLAREAGELGLQAPLVLPASIWNGIAGELGIGAAPAAEYDTRVPGQRSAESTAFGEHAAATDGRRSPAAARHSVGRNTRQRAWRRAVLVAAVVVAVGAGIGTGVAIGRREAPPVVALQSQAVLKPIATGPATAHGTATVTQGSAGTTLRVAARELPLRQGYYEVWLYNPQANKMVAVGTLGSGGDGIWTLASTIDLRSYSVVNVSAQDFDGNPAHKDSVLQGPLTE